MCACVCVCVLTYRLEVVSSILALCVVISVCVEFLSLNNPIDITNVILIANPRLSFS